MLDIRLSNDDLFNDINTNGYFALMSSRKIAIDKILPLYYTRQEIEQVFDVSENYTDLFPLEIHSEETFKGHLLLTFISTIIIKKLMKLFCNTNYTIEEAFQWLSAHQCRIFDDIATVNEKSKNIAEIYRIGGVNVPETLPIP